MTLVALVLACVLAAHLAARGGELQGVVARGLAGLMIVDAARSFLSPWPALYASAFVAWYWLMTRVVARALDPSGPSAGQAFALLAASSPLAIRHGLTPELARASFALALAAQLLALLHFASRGKRPDDAQRVALILAASSLADVAGPWLLGEPGRDWFAGRWPAVITWAAIAGWEGRCLINVRRRRGTC